MFVLIAAKGYPTINYKAGIFEFDQAKALKSLGVDVAFVSVDLRSIRRWRKWGYQSIKMNDIDIYNISIPLGRLPQIILNHAYTYGLFLLYKKIVRERSKPDIVHAHFTEMAYASSKLKEKFSIPVVVTEHSSKINQDYINRVLTNTAKQAYEKADILIAVSKVLADKIFDNFGRHALIIPNIVDTEIFNYVPRTRGNEFNIVSVGNLIELKGMNLLIDAFHNAFTGKENIKLSIFGDGIKRNDLLRQIENYGLQEQIILKGLCERREIAKALEISDCFVLASKSETFGVSFIEALSVGVPVIATKCGGPEAYVSEKNGILVPVDDVPAMSKALLDMYKYGNRFDREKIAVRTKNEFLSSHIAEQIIDVYMDILHSI